MYIFRKILDFCSVLINAHFSTGALARAQPRAQSFTINECCINYIVGFIQTILAHPLSNVERRCS
jgi:hypothetical protein